jgi:Zn-dependent M32 family carboxypeptidase
MQERAAQTAWNFAAQVENVLSFDEAVLMPKEGVRTRARLSAKFNSEADGSIAVETVNTGGPGNYICLFTK